MKRTITTLLIFTLALTLLLPASALAKRGGVPASPSGKGAAAAQDSNGRGPVQKVDDVEAVKPTPPGHEKRDVRGSEEEAPGDGVTEQKRERVRTEESSATPEPKRTGIENALSRLQRNLERMQSDLDAGKRTSLPAGLQGVIARFMAWLGIEVEEPGGGVDDGDGSVEPTGTVEPTSTVEPTTTPDVTATP